MDSAKNLTEVLDLILDGISVVVDAEKDGKISVEDLPLLMKLIPDLGPAFSDLGKVPAELTSLSEADATALVAHVMAKLSISDTHATQVIAAALKAAVAVYGLVSAIKAPATA